MTIYHYGMTLTSINGLLGQCPTWLSMIRKEESGAANALFEKSIPKFVKLRTSVAHHAQVRSLKQYDLHKIKGPASVEGILLGDSVEIMIAGSLFGRQFTATHEGKVVSYELSEESLGVLREVKRRFYSAFLPVQEDMLKSLAHRHLKDEQPE